MTHPMDSATGQRQRAMVIHFWISGEIETRVMALIWKEKDDLVSVQCRAVEIDEGMVKSGNLSGDFPLIWHRREAKSLITGKIAENRITENIRVVFGKVFMVHFESPFSPLFFFSVGCSWIWLENTVYVVYKIQMKNSVDCTVVYFTLNEYHDWADSRSNGSLFRINRRVYGWVALSYLIHIQLESSVYLLLKIVLDARLVSQLVMQYIQACVLSVIGKEITIIILTREEFIHMTNTMMFGSVLFVLTKNELKGFEYRIRIG